MEIQIRNKIFSSDIAAIRKIVASSGFFTADEIKLATELAQEAVEKGTAGGYEFLLAEISGEVSAYTCFGSIPATESSYDLYWIAVHNNYRGSGIGSTILNQTELRIKAMGGNRVYIETSSTPLYQPTRQFYLKNTYRLETCLEDFYRQGDGKCIYVKVL